MRFSTITPLAFTTPPINITDFDVENISISKINTEIFHSLEIVLVNLGTYCTHFLEFQEQTTNSTNS